ncbi:MAG: hypothetical protein ABEK59_13270 [Halobacteria archaeon]
MTHSKKRFGLTLSSAVAAVVLVLYIIWSAQMALALTSVLGTGGFYAEAQYFVGHKGGGAYPQMLYDDHGTIKRMGGGAVNESAMFIPGPTDTFKCKSIPMLVIELKKARVYGFNAKVHIQLPILDRWMRIGIEQPVEKGSPDQPDSNGFKDSAYIQGETLRVYTSQLHAENLTIRNIRITETAYADDGKYRVWGPKSDQFQIIADPGGKAEADGLRPIFARNVSAWMHGVGGEKVAFRSNAQNRTLNFNISYPRNSTVRDWVRRHEIAGYSASNARVGTSKASYNTCKPKK